MTAARVRELIKEKEAAVAREDYDEAKRIKVRLLPCLVGVCCRVWAHAVRVACGARYEHVWRSCMP